MFKKRKTKKNFLALKKLGFEKMKNTDGLIMFELVPSKLNKKKGD
jgi:hypothetical protein